MHTENRIRALRLARAWSQEQLAELSAVSVRTIQRIEKGEPPSLETLSALAAVFETRVEELTGAPLQAAGPLDDAVLTARRRLDAEGRFYRSLITALVVCFGLFLLNRFTAPESHWSLWVVLIWGGLLTVKGLRLFLLRGWIEQWQQQRLQKLLRK
ncbi:helix-turn-helix domain-containing protein [Cronobacter turicensis]|uniref:helix-turn-helix domain-containing protein n=1 Tax=Cronobacter turicensis TaxID=413502 RepID=UPI000CFDCAE5|nr:helix-turn-helix domain-containing protein [Cronobacter turicensis]EGT4493015.1 helix-turn-helix domain-containing protein [Cronobacter turicensis]EKM0438710.1 helix-turn-helix domain-containing protein [Cronobacter turicensis]ELY4322304.1 helix-turn-helix domain-containing protein [Cronobacter turicensis]ELY4607841.1 helix-turn-helix domain-containing protein [Cronobacter turicensis]ELY5944569.1 helix-turn-helix domain-containing protein [Cronobacter turicensis]